MSYIFTNKEDVAKSLSFIVFKAVNHLNDRAKLHMTIDQATDLVNDLIKLLMNEHSQKAILKYVSFCARVKNE